MCVRAEGITSVWHFTPPITVPHPSSIFRMHPFPRYAPPVGCAVAVCPLSLCPPCSSSLGDVAPPVSGPPSGEWPLAHRMEKALIRRG